MSSIFNALFRSASTSAPVATPIPGKPTITQQAPANAGPSAPPPSPIPPTADRARHVSAPSPLAAANADPPYPPSPFTPGHGNITVDRSYDLTNSTISEPTDILYPRGVSFVHRRQHLAQAEADGTPLKHHAFYQPSPSRGKPITIRDPADPAPPKPRPVQLTEWRKEQIRRQNQARLVEPIVLKAIPALHGPPNLPYARNPSGVDASIPDDSTAYLSFPTNNPSTAQSSRGELRVPRADPPATYVSQVSQDGRAPNPAILHPPTIRMTDRVPYQQHFDTADLIHGDGGLYQRGTSMQSPRAVYEIQQVKPEVKLTPSEMLRAQIQAVPPSRPLESIIEHPIHPDHPVAVSRPVYIDITRKGLASLSAPATIAAQKIAEDVESYPTAPRYVVEPNTKSTKGTATAPPHPSKPLTEEELAAKVFLANSKADASVNWRLKTPAKASGSRIVSYESKYLPSVDRSDDAPTMTIDSLFEKFAPSSGSGPITIKVKSPPNIDPAVKEVSKTPFTFIHPDSHLLRAPSPDLSIPIARTTIASAPDTSLTASDSTVEDLINLSSDRDENTKPVPLTPKFSKAKGTPGAGKLLKRNSGKGASKDEVEMMPVGPLPNKAKAPLGMARTVSSTAKGKTSRVA